MAASFDSLHREIKSVFPTLHLFDGAKFDFTSILSQNFQVSHSLSFGSQGFPSVYNFGAGYSCPEALLHGQVDHTGALSGRAHYHWFPVPSPTVDPVTQQPVMPDAPKQTSTSKIQAQMGGQQAMSMVQLEHEYIGPKFAVTGKAMNPNLLDRPAKGSTMSSATGIYSLSSMFPVTPSLLVGGEINYARPMPDVHEPGFAIGARYAPIPTSPLPLPPSLPAGMPSPYMPVNPSDPTQILTTTYSPSTGLIHASYWRRLNQRLEVASELQLLITPKSAGSKREGIANMGFKLDTIYATIRGMIDTHGRVSTVLEEKIAPGLSFQITGEMDYSKAQGGQGKVGVGFTLEA